MTRSDLVPDAWTPNGSIAAARKPRLLVLSVEVSGMNRYLFGALARDWDLAVFDVPRRALFDLWAKAASFRPGLNAWRKSLDRLYERGYKSAGMFRWRTRQCDRELRRREGSYDIVLQVSGMYAPWEGAPRAPHVVLTSYTLKLAERAYPAWAPFPSEADAAAWFRLEQRLYRGARRVLTTTEHARRSVVHDYGIPAHRVITVGYGVPLDGCPDGLPEYDRTTVLFVGKDFERKGGLVLLEAFDRVRRMRPEARLVVVGPNPARVGRRDPGVEWLGEVRDRARLGDLYRGAHVFVMPSLCEPFGLAFLEAMAHGLPCIGTTVDAMPEIIEHGRTGFLVPRGDAGALASAILRLLGDPARAREMGLLGRERARTAFTWDTMADRITQALHSALGEGLESHAGGGTLTAPSGRGFAWGRERP